MKVKAYRNKLTQEEAYINQLGLRKDNIYDDIDMEKVWDVYAICIDKSHKMAGENNGYSFGKVQFLDEHGLWNFAGFYNIIDNSMPSDWIVVDKFEDYRQYSPTGFSLIIGPKEIFGKNAFKAWVEIFEGGEMQEKFNEYVKKQELLREKE